MQDKLDWCICCKSAFCECICHDREDQLKKLEIALRAALKDVKKIIEHKKSAIWVFQECRDAANIAELFAEMHLEAETAKALAKDPSHTKKLAKEAN